MSRVALIGENSIGYIETLLTIWNEGDCAVMLDWRIPFTTILEMMSEAGVEKCYIEFDLFSKFCKSEYVSNHIEFIPYKRMNYVAKAVPQTVVEKYRENYSMNEAVVIYSSGTTGRSKGIILSHYAINTNADAIIDYMKPQNNDCIYIAKTLSHSSTLTGELLVALKSKMKIVVAPTIVPPRYIMKAIKEHDVTMICFSVKLLSLFISTYEQKPCALSSLRVIYVSGSIYHDSLYDKVRRILTDIPVYNAYGLSETAPRLSVQTKSCCKSNSVGKPIKGVELAIVGEEGVLVRDGERGVIHVNTPCMYNGYIVGTEKNRSLYRNWFNTGDIGFIDQYGELHVVGRVDDVIICAAHKIYPSDIENLIMKHLSVSECVVVKCMLSEFEMIGCLYVSDIDRSKEIYTKLKKHYMQYEIPKFYLKVDSIPHNSRGKVDRKSAAIMLSEKMGNGKVLGMEKI